LFSRHSQRAPPVSSVAVNWYEQDEHAIGQPDSVSTRLPLAASVPGTPGVPLRSLNQPPPDQPVVASENEIQKSLEMAAVPVFRTVSNTRPFEMPSLAQVNWGEMSADEMDRSGTSTVAVRVTDPPLDVHEYSVIVFGSPSRAASVQPHDVTAVLVRRATVQSFGGAARRASSVTLCEPAGASGPISHPHTSGFAPIWVPPETRTRSAPSVSMILTNPAVDPPVLVTVIVHVTVFDGFAQSRVAVEGVIVTDRVGAEAVKEGDELAVYCVPPQQS
jgi:hypothetical protein